jgi:hypothetical protein
VQRLKDPDDSVRAAAASALARIGIGNLGALGKQALADRSLAVRLAAVELLVAVIAICGNANSFLATQADYLMNTTVDAEACPNNLAPTSSTTAQLVMGDAS